MSTGERVHVCVQRELREVQKQWSHSEAQAAEILHHNRQAQDNPSDPSFQCLKLRNPVVTGFLPAVVIKFRDNS